MPEDTQEDTQREKKEEPETEDGLSKCQKERDEYLDGWKRAKAELANYKKDEGKRFEAVVKFANESLIRELITVLDSFDLALIALEQSRINADQDADKRGLNISENLRPPASALSASDWRAGSNPRESASLEKGLFLIRQQLEDMLRQNGLERVIISVGQPFDPAREEAIAHVESDKPSGTVVEEVEKGYFLNGKLVRPARVKVSK